MSENDHVIGLVRDVALEPFGILAEAGEMIRAPVDHVEKRERRTACGLMVLLQVPWVSREQAAHLGRCPFLRFDGGACIP